MIDSAEVLKHNSPKSCWLVLYGRVYDVTEFLTSHPGGSAIILAYAGQDATDEYDPIHPAGAIEEHLPVDAYLGEVDPATVSKAAAKAVRTRDVLTENTPLSTIINLNDFEHVAQQSLSPNAWAYYSSGSDDEISKQMNRKAFQNVSLRSRVLRNVEIINTSTMILGQKTSMPVFVSPAAIAKLAHPLGECAIASGVGKEGLIQVVSTSSSMSIEDIMYARVEKEQPVFFQLYVNRDINKSKALIRRAEQAGVKAIWITVDSAVIGKREQDERIRAKVTAGENGGAISQGQEVMGIGRTMGAIITPRLSWGDLLWIREATNLPLVIKGIQCVEDAILAYEHGVQGIVLSNHGGRHDKLTLNSAQAPLLTLLEINKYAPFLLTKMEIYLDGGVRRGTDILKAVALGATAVGLGRPFLYALTAGYGEDGVRKLVSILRAELMSNMALAGARNLGEITRAMLNPSRLERDLVAFVKL
ncbi:cytochrome b2 [Hyaloscypha variabilis]